MSSLLGSTLEKYVQNFDAKNLQISLTAGKVKLNALLLRADVLTKELDLPFRVKWGKLDGIELQISWKGPTSNPIVVRIEEVFILASPITDQPYDAADAAEKAYQAKVELLKAFEEALASAGTEEEADDDPGKTAFRVISNVQVHVGRVHVRYEDTGASSGVDPVAFGLTLHELSAQSAEPTGDSNTPWRICQQAPSDDEAYKLLKMDRLGVYFDPELAKDCAFSRLESYDDLDALFKSTFRKASDANYVVRPIISKGLLTINKKVSSEGSSAKLKPRATVELDFGELAAALTDVQYRQAIKSVDYFSWLFNRASVRHLRPDTPLKKGTAARWWRFAGDAVSIDIKRRVAPWRWSCIKARRDKRIEYIQLFTAVLAKNGDVAKALKKIDKATSARIEALERELDIEDIKRYRRQTRAQVKAKPKKKKRSWWGGSSDADNDPAPGVSAAELERERKEFQELIAREAQFETPANPEWVKFSGKLSIAKISVQMFESGDGDSATTELMQLSLDGAQIGFEQRNAPGAIDVAMMLDDVSVMMLRYDNNLHRVLRVVHEGPRFSADDKVLNLKVNLKPLPLPGAAITPDVRVKLASKPTELYLTAPGLKRIAQFFKTAEVPDTLDLSAIQDAAAMYQREALEVGRAGLTHAVESQPIVDLDVQLAAPRMVIPAQDGPSEDTLVLIADLGVLNLRSEIRENDELLLSKLSDSEIADRAYEVYNINVENMQILFTQAGEDWIPELNRQTTPYHIVDKTTLSVKLERCLAGENRAPRLPELRVNTVLPKLAIRISDVQIGEFLRYGDLVAREFAEVGGPVDDAAAAPTPIPPPTQSGKPLRQPSVEQTLAIRVADANYIARKRSNRIAKALTKFAEVDVQVMEIGFTLLSDDMSGAPPTDALKVSVINLKLAADARQWDNSANFTMGGLFVASVVDAGNPAYMVHTAHSTSCDWTKPITIEEMTKRMSTEDSFVEVEANILDDNSPLFQSSRSAMYENVMLRHPLIKFRKRSAARASARPPSHIPYKICFPEPGAPNWYKMWVQSYSRTYLEKDSIGVDPEVFGLIEVQLVNVVEAIAAMTDPEYKILRRARQFKSRAEYCKVLSAEFGSIMSLKQVINEGFTEERAADACDDLSIAAFKTWLENTELVGCSFPVKISDLESYGLDETARFEMVGADKDSSGTLSRDEVVDVLVKELFGRSSQIEASVKIQTLEARVSQEHVIDLMVLLDGMVKKIKRVAVNGKDAASLGKAPVVRDSPEQLDQNIVIQAGKAAVANAIDAVYTKVRLEAAFEAMRVVLTAGPARESVFDAEISKIMIKSRLALTYTVATVSLANLLVRDMTPLGAKYRNIVQSGDNTGTLVSLIYEEFAEAQNGFDSRVVAYMNQLQLVFLNRWLSELLGFIAPITEATESLTFADEVQELSAAYSASVSDDFIEQARSEYLIASESQIALEQDVVVKKNIATLMAGILDKVKPELKPPPKMSIKAVLQGPQVVVPQSSSSDAALVVELGVLYVDNTFESEAVEGVITEQINAKITDVKAFVNRAITLADARKAGMSEADFRRMDADNSGMLTQLEYDAWKGKATMNIMSCSHLTASFLHPVFKARNASYVPEVDLGVVLGPTKLILQNTDIPFILVITTMNLTEQAAVCIARTIPSSEAGFGLPDRDALEFPRGTYDSDEGEDVDDLESLASFVSRDSRLTGTMVTDVDDGLEQDLSDFDFDTLEPPPELPAAVGTSMRVNFTSDMLAVELFVSGGDGGLSSGALANLALLGIHAVVDMDPQGTWSSGQRQPTSMRVATAIRSISIKDARGENQFPDFLRCLDGTSQSLEPASVDPAQRVLVEASISMVHRLVRIVGCRELENRSEEEIWHAAVAELLSSFGPIVRFYLDNGRGQKAAVAYVEFAEIRSSFNAIEFINGHTEELKSVLRYADWAANEAETAVDAEVRETEVLLSPGFLVDLIKFAPTDESANDNAADADTKAAPKTANSATTESSGPATRSAVLVFQEGSDGILNKTELDQPGNAKVEAKISKQSIVLLEDERFAQTRGIGLAVDAEVVLQTRYQNMNMTAKVTDVAASSFRMDLRGKKEFAIIPAVPKFSCSAVVISEADVRTRVNLAVSGINLNIAMRDVNTLNKVSERATAAFQPDEDDDPILWDETPNPVTTIEDVAATKSNKSSIGLTDEALYLMMSDAINITLVDNIGVRERPLAMISVLVNCENGPAEVRNWSSDLIAKLTVDLAVSTMCSRTLAWQPVLDGGCDQQALPDGSITEVVMPFSAELNIAAPDEQWAPDDKSAEDSAVVPRVVKCNKGTKRSARYIFDPKKDSYWDSGDSLSVKKDLWFIVDMQQPVTVLNYSFTTFNRTVPRECRLFCGPDSKCSGKWTDCSVKRDKPPKPSGASKDLYTFERPDFEKPVTGRYLKFRVYRLHSGNRIRIVGMQFKVIPAGTAVGLTAVRPMQLTLASANIVSLSKAAESFAVIGDEEQGAQAVGTADVSKGGHEVKNLTGFTVHVSPGQLHESGDDSATTLIENGQASSIEFSAASIASDGAHLGGAQLPITEIDVLNMSEIGGIVPEGWELIDKRLNPGATHDLRIVVKRGYPEDSAPITDIHVKYGGATDARLGRCEPVPEGYQQVLKGCTGRDRLAYICYYRGNAAPIVDIAVVRPDNSNETVPYGYAKIPKNVNLGTDKNQTYLCVLRQRMKRTNPGEPVLGHAVVGKAAPTLVTEVVGADSEEELKQYLKSPAEGGCSPWLTAARPSGEQDTSSGKGTFLLYRYNPKFPPITRIEVFKSSNVPNHEKIRKLISKEGLVPVISRSAMGLLNFGSTQNSGQPSVFLGVGPDKGGAPISRIGLYDEKRDEIPPGAIVMDDRISRSKSGKHGLRLTIIRADVAEGTYEYDDTDEADAGAPAAVVNAPQANSKTQSKLLALKMLGAKLGHLSFTVEVDGWKPLVGIPADRSPFVGTYVLEPAWRESTVRLIVSVREVCGSKVITLSSPTVVQNCFEIPLSLCHQQMLRDETEHHVLQPGEMFALPLGLADNITDGKNVTSLERFVNLASRRQFMTRDPLDVAHLAGGGEQWVSDALVGYVWPIVEPGQQMQTLWGTHPRARTSDFFKLEVSKIDADPAQFVGRGLHRLGYVYSERGPGKNMRV